MTPHYDLNQQENNNGVLGAGLGGGRVTNIFVIYLQGEGGGGRVCFPTGLGRGVVKIFAYHMKCNRPPPHHHLVINALPLMKAVAMWGPVILSAFATWGSVILSAVKMWDPVILSAVATWGPVILSAVATWGPVIFTGKKAAFINA